MSELRSTEQVVRDILAVFGGFDAQQFIPLSAGDIVGASKVLDEYIGEVLADENVTNEGKRWWPSVPWS